MKHIYSRIIRSIASATALFVATLAAAPSAAAFSADTYAASSALASGTWMKVSVQESGIHFISNSQLRSWGFRTPANVRIHGSGGVRIPDNLTPSSFVDDLPPVQALHTAEGIYFYAVGPVSWTKTSSGQFYQNLNPFTSLGYYFLTESTDPAPEIPETGRDTFSDNFASTFTERLFYEVDQVSLSQTGHRLYGDDFRYTRQRSYNFRLTDMIPESSVWMRCSMGTITSSASSVTFSVNGTQLPGSNTIRQKPADDTPAVGATFQRSFKVDSEKLTFGITFTPSGVVTAAHLDGITINYQRKLRLANDKLEFEVALSSVRLEDATTATHVWDITSPSDIRSLSVRKTDGAEAIQWQNTAIGARRYVAWNEKPSSFPSPKLVGSIRNQDLHNALHQLHPEMIIVTVDNLASEAQRLADLHNSQGLKTMVVDQRLIFNEFGSGSPDAGAIRRFLKMAYDLGNDSSSPLRFALLFGRATFDNRTITPEMKAAGYTHLSTWQTDEPFSLAASYTSDDFFGALADNAATPVYNADLSIAVGRIPAANLDQARTMVDKIYSYVNSPHPSEWRNQVLMVADNGDLGTFMLDSERQYTTFRESTLGSDMFYTKVYIDAFSIQGGTCAGGRERFYRVIDEGALWWTYIGHGNKTMLAEENVFTSHDIKNMTNRRLPVFFGATCSFSRWDGPDICGTEAMAFTPAAGVISAIGPTREAYISDNGTLSEAIGRYAFEINPATGYVYTPAQALMLAKNDIRKNATSTTREQLMRFVFLGDPALDLALPKARVRLTAINGEEPTPDAQVTVMARQNVTVDGQITDMDGQPINDFNGVIYATMYDAEHSTTSNGLKTGGAKPTEGKKVTFEEQGDRLYAGRDSVKAGNFRLSIPMPSEVADNFRPAALNMFANSSAGQSASGCNRDFYVFGMDENATPDDNAPLIDYAYLNHHSFTDGTTVNELPMFIARVSDDIGINMSMAGIGHQMTLKLDGNKSFSDVSLYYTPSADGTPSGTVAYPLDELSPGAHSLTFRVWDTSGNSASRTIDFFVERGAMPKVFDVFTDVNPATTEANFFVDHNRPDATLTVTIEVFNMLGRRIWTSTVTDRSDMFLSAPVRWNLCDMGGARVGRGIYIYRAIVKTDGHELRSAAKRIAVTGH